ncbi:uncharacterized protein MELLADRAFT_116045 [Melampsora larici-populina 98AG31]|uniref:Uncharacterized protein n=1 Tax=Melampsora larici-populina (strain 98AG31 / pathotype 3-4-7) TaxID=747676 RepID=F4RH82_MELLP|nr:uncharacterized protein MELLADRAFT_116045 [Melampsora larici-populina 98AG31]EGG08147.1 hypothetical protein MELLADRAFT_116045 [Melampsora larici-populina 98AG31]
MSYRGLDEGMRRSRSLSNKGELIPRHLIPTKTPFHRACQVTIEQSLYPRIGQLLRLNKFGPAISLYHQHLTAKTRESRRDVDSSGRSADISSLLRSAQLFRSYGHPQLAIDALNSLRAFMDSLAACPTMSSSSSHTHAAVSFFQACNELTWRSSTHAKGYGQSASIGHHIEIGKLLARIRRVQEPGHQDRHQSPKQQNIKAQSVTNLSCKIQITSAEDSKVLEVILGTLLKLGEPDWLVSILRDAFPRFINQIGVHLYPHLPRQTFDQPWQLIDIPNGRLVKFLVASYSLSRDVDRAYVICRFYRRLWNLHRGEEARDVAPDINLLRAISRLPHITEKHIRMVRNILGGMQNDGIALDTYVLEGLMDSRYRMRSHWGLRRPHATAFHVLQALLDQSIGLFLLHWRRPITFKMHSQPGKTQLIKGVSQGQRQLRAWKLRPTGRSFTLCLLSLRSKLKYEARLAIRQKTYELNHSFQLDSTYQVDKNPQSSSRRPSPGLHRSLMCQMIVLETIHASNCNVRSSQSDTATYLPSRHRLLTSINLKLCLEVFLCAKDYAGACVLLRHIRYTYQEDRPVTLFELVMKEIPDLVKKSLRLPEDYDSFLNYIRLSGPVHESNTKETDMHLIPELSSPEIQANDQKHADLTDLNVYKALEVLLRCCEPNRPDDWWNSELAAVTHFLRKQMTCDQYKQISLGIKD